MEKNEKGQDRSKTVTLKIGGLWCCVKIGYNYKLIR